MNAKDRAQLLSKTSEKPVDTFEGATYDGHEAKAQWEKENWNDGVAHRKNALGDPK